MEHPQLKEQRLMLMFQILKNLRVPTGSELFLIDMNEKLLKARNEAIKAATEKYLSEMAKKKHSQRERAEKEK